MYKKRGTINNHTRTVDVNQCCPWQNMLHAYTHTSQIVHINVGLYSAFLFSVGSFEIKNMYLLSFSFSDYSDSPQKYSS